MRAQVGDSIRIDTASEQTGEVTEVLGPDGSPPYRVRLPNGHEIVVIPPDTGVEHRELGDQS